MMTRDTPFESLKLHYRIMIGVRHHFAPVVPTIGQVADLIRDNPRALTDHPNFGAKSMRDLLDALRPYQIGGPAK